MKRWERLLLVVFLLLAGVFPAQAQTLPAEAVVRAVLFYSPTCGHCHKVITEDLPPLFEKYGSRLYIVGIDVSQPEGQAWFMASLQYFKLESSGVPFLVVGDTYLVGSVSIPEKLPGLVEAALLQGGLDWPAIPGMAEAMRGADATATAMAHDVAPDAQTLPAATLTPVDAHTPAAHLLTAPPTASVLLTGGETSGLRAGFANDPLGNSLAVFVLAGMLISILAAALLWRRSSGAALPPSWNWLIPILCIVGMGVAGYLAYVETAQVEAVCGPVGDCNTVQQSEYARLFGILPIGLLGLAGYVMILLAWGLGRLARRLLSAYADLALCGMAAFGLLFSIYLTFLEPFVIGATCAWCLTSAILITALFWLGLLPGKLAFNTLFHGETYAL